ncbi:MAG: 23S rRNA (uracil(1939)-C(5))-methyltransferase RlmD [Lachnospiraceae bacterium]|jgi:23S rRNA (uracil-5-)-methyltransferase RumA|nr:23S rRNA (uracil(1939)-C(5))-methyltransferase RlmD [Lachnospiraceae bacterium]
MKKGQVVSGTVTRLDFPNLGIVICDGVEIAVKNVLPGQKITFVITKSSKKAKVTGRLLSVDIPSPTQITSPCPHFGVCGGCLMQNIAYEEQLRIKEEQVRRLLDIENWEGIVASPCHSHYRNKMEYTFGDRCKDGALELGLHCRNSFYDIITVNECRIADDDFNRILAYTHEYFAALYQVPPTSTNSASKVTFYHRRRGSGFLRHLLLRKGVVSGEIIIALVTTSQMDFDLEEWKQGLLSLSLTGTVNGVLHIINDGVADTIKADEVRLLHGRDWFSEKILGMTFKITPFSFFQTNSLGAEVLYQMVRKYQNEISSLSKSANVIFDLYCGTGTISLVLAKTAARVIGIDSSEEAIAAAKENYQRNQEEHLLAPCTFIAGDVLKVIDETSETPDLIVLDPPRDGVHPKALPKILAYKAPHIIYISCKPTSLARDLVTFTAVGYYPKRAVAVDLFPATANVEVVCWFSLLK